MRVPGGPLDGAVGGVGFGMGGLTVTGGKYAIINLVFELVGIRRTRGQPAKSAVGGIPLYLSICDHLQWQSGQWVAIYSHKHLYPFQKVSWF